jgi:hypothetical protein
MANATRSNKIYIDSTGAVATVRKKIAYIIFTPDAANDVLAIRETSSDQDIVYIRAATAKDTQVYDFSYAPLVFQNGVYIQTLTSGAKATLVTVEGGSSGT